MIRHPDARHTTERPRSVPCPCCGREPWICPACQSPRLVLTPECGYWAVCRDCGFPIGGTAA